MWSLKLKCENRSTKRCSVAGSTRSAPLMMPSTPPRSSPARSASFVLRAAKSKAKLGADDHACGFSASARTHRAGLSRNADRAGQLCVIAAQDRRADAEHQTHVVVEGQPRHKRGIRRDFGVRKKTDHQLLEIHRQIAVRHHHPGGQFASNPSCTANTRCSVHRLFEGLARPRHPASTHRSRRSSARCPCVIDRRNRRRLRLPRTS